MRWWLTLHRWTGDGPSGMELLDDHLAWNRREHEAGRLLFSGPAEGLALAVMVFRGGDDLPREAVEALLTGEPLVAAGHRTVEVLEWDVRQVLGAGPFSVAELAAGGRVPAGAGAGGGAEARAGADGR